MNVIKVTPEMRTLALGRLGENEVTQFVFDVSDWLEEFPGATIGLANSLPHTNVSYPCALENEGEGNYSWTITSAELTVQGDGKCELILTKDGAVKMGKIYKTKIDEALDPDEDPPEEWEGFITQVTGLKEGAEDAAEDAEDAASDAEAYAVGTRGGTDVESTDPAYHNNSKYYSEQAGSSATAAAGSATTAGNKASDAEAYAVGKRGGVDVESGDAAYHNNSKYYSEQAAGSATAAAASAAQAGSKANRSVIAKEYADLTYPVTKGTWCFHDGVLYEANQAISTSEAWTAAHWTELTVEGATQSVLSDFRHVTPEQFGAKGDGTTDDSTAVQRAVDAGYEVRFADNKMYYLASAVTIDHDCHLIGGANTVIKTQSVTENEETSLNNAFLVSGTLKKTTTLTTDYTQYGQTDNSANKFTLSDMTDIEIGDLLEIVATDQFYSYTRQYYYLGAMLMVSHILDGHLYTNCDMPFDIENTQNVSVKVYSAPSVVVENLHFVSDRAHVGFKYAVQFERCKNSSILNCTADNLWNCFRFYHCFNSFVDNVTVANGKYDNTMYHDSYGICIESCTNTIVQRVNALDAQGCVEISGTIPSINTFIKYCNVSAECRTVGIDMHDSVYNVVVEDCITAGLALFGKATVNRCKIFRNNLINNEYGITIHGSHNPKFSEYRIIDCELPEDTKGFISITDSATQNPSGTFDCVFGYIEITNCKGGFLKYAPTATQYVTSYTIKRLLLNNWQNCYEIYHTQNNVIEFMEVSECTFVVPLKWINKHSDAWWTDYIYALHIVSNSKNYDRWFIDSGTKQAKFRLPAGTAVTFNSSDSSAHYTVCGKNVMSNNPSDFSVGGVGKSGDVMNRTVNANFASAVSVDSNGKLVYTQPNNTTKCDMYLKCFAYAKEGIIARMSCVLKNTGATSGASFRPYIAVINCETGKLVDRYSGNSGEASVNGTVISFSKDVPQNSLVLFYLYCSTPVANSETTFEDFVAETIPYIMDVGSVTYEPYQGASRDGDGSVASVEGINNIMSSAYDYNTKFKADYMEL